MVHVHFHLLPLQPSPPAPLQHATQFLPHMDDFAGLMVPRPAHAAWPSHAEIELAWTLIIESGHIPLYTRLGTCNKALYRPLRWRHLMWTQRIIYQDLYNVWALLRANRNECPLL